jgi:hypothetical protein
MKTISRHELDLSDDEVELVRQGLLHWGGPARPTDEFAVAMGFDNASDMSRECSAISAVLASRGALGPFDWTRAVLCLEVAFSSDLVGAGYEWSIVTGFTDEFTVRGLRSIQRKLARVVFPVIRSGALRRGGKSPDDR